MSEVRVVCAWVREREREFVDKPTNVHASSSLSLASDVKPRISSSKKSLHLFFIPPEFLPQPAKHSWNLVDTSFLGTIYN